MRIPIGVHDTPLPLLLGDDTGPLPLLGGMAVGDADATRYDLNLEKKREEEEPYLQGCVAQRHIAECNT